MNINITASSPRKVSVYTDSKQVKIEIMNPMFFSLRGFSFLPLSYQNIAPTESSSKRNRIPSFRKIYHFCFIFTQQKPSLSPGA